MGIELTNEQVYCIYELENWWHKSSKQVFDISGPAGSGKTSIVRFFIERLGLDLDEVLFVAYAGKAATVLQRNGLPAKTIHSAIYKYEKVIEKDEKGRIIFDDRGHPKVSNQFILKDKLPKKIKLIVVDEGSMVPEDIGRDLLSFGKPVVVLGDLNQLPPVFGNPIFLNNPSYTLTQVMRQVEGSPIIYLSQKVLKGEPLKFGVYGRSFIIPKSDITDFHLKHADSIITCTNKLRYSVNNYYRTNIKKIKNLEYPHINEKVVCRKNNWDMCLDKGFYMTNGMTGFVDYIYRDSFDKRSMQMDFRPDFLKKSYKKVKFDYKHLYEVPGGEEVSSAWYYDKFEFAYALTCHIVQGSQFPNVLFMYEDFSNNSTFIKKLMYTAITRATESIGIVL